MSEPELRRVRGALYSVVRGGRSYEVALDIATDSGGTTSGEATVDGQRVPIDIEGRRRRANIAGAPEGAARGPVTVAAPMPGRIVSVPVAVGTLVERGQTIVVLEAMKMESTLSAPAAGTVTEVMAEPGQAVQQRQPLVRIEPTPAVETPTPTP
jgi:biotin carboxyl carrier protein